MIHLVTVGKKLLDPQAVSVIYHANCYDGICSAWVAFQKFGAAASYHPMNYGDLLPKKLNPDVIFIDFSLKRPALEELAKVTSSLLILDHHKTAQEDLADLPYAVFDMERSGAGIAWDYFFPREKGFDRHPLVNYVEDRDLWRFRLPNSREYNAFIQSYPKELGVWLRELGKSFYPSQSILQAGEALLRQQDSLAEDICKNAIFKPLPSPGSTDHPHPEPVPSVYTSVLMSEVCGKLLDLYPDAPFVYYYFRRADGKYQFGLRSKNPFDVSTIARAYGGGGHKNAAGFEINFGD